MIHISDDAVNRPNVDIVHQDDDGFESLNGNVSSDNDRASVQVQQINDNEVESIVTSTSSDERLLTYSEPPNINNTIGLFILYFCFIYRNHVRFIISTTLYIIMKC